jgi:hypothetical protein
LRSAARRLWIPLVLAGLLTATAAFGQGTKEWVVPAGSGKYTGMTRGQLETEVVKELNLRRQKEGLAPLVLDERVSRIARNYSDDVITSKARTNQVISGADPNGGPAGHWYITKRVEEVRTLLGPQAHFAENCQWTGTPESVVNSWMSSPPHKASMLHATPNLVGTGIGIRQSAGDFDQWYTAIFTSGTAQPNEAPKVATPKATDVKIFLGAYERRPVQPGNGWHKGRITMGENNLLKWTNEAGKSWTLKPEPFVLRTSTDNPYHNDNIRDFKIIFKTRKDNVAEVLGFKFGEEVFTRTGN